MGKKALEIRRTMVRSIRSSPLSDAEGDYLKEHATYEGSPHHKRNPGDFGLMPPAAPRADKTLCDEAGICRLEEASELFDRAIAAGLVSEQFVGQFPKYMWVIDGEGRAFEAIYGGSRTGRYHGYPIRRSNPFFDEIVDAWNRR